MPKHNIKKKIFSVELSPDNTHNVLTLCGFNIKIAQSGTQGI